MKKSFIYVFAACLLPGLALAQWGEGGYFGTTTVNTANLDIAVQSVRYDFPMVGLENRSGQPAQCRATFSNGAQFSETRQVTVPAGKSKILYYPLHYITSKVDIDVNCS